MRVFFLSKKQFFLLSLLLILIISFAWNNQGLILPAATNQDLQPFYEGNTANNKVSLAINVDWGEEFLPDILKVLAENEVKATFFLTGRWVEKNPQLALNIVQQGHEIGNHAYSHSSPNKNSYEKNQEEIEKTGAAIKNILGTEPFLYAPPSGEREDHVLQAARDLGYTTVLWTVDTIDWQRPAADVIIQRVTDKVKAGSIVLMHPTNPTLEALPIMLDFIKKQGLELVPVSVNLGL